MRSDAFLARTVLEHKLRGFLEVERERAPGIVRLCGIERDLDGKIIRIAHMGAVDEYDVLTGLSCLEKVLKEAGHKFELGASLAAAQKVLNS